MLTLMLLLACEPDTAVLIVGDPADTDADADSDSDSDTDADTDSDSDADTDPIGTNTDATPAVTSVTLSQLPQLTLSVAVGVSGYVDGEQVDLQVLRDDTGALALLTGTAADGVATVELVLDDPCTTLAAVGLDIDVSLDGASWTTAHVDLTGRPFVYDAPNYDDDLGVVDELIVVCSDEPTTSKSFVIRTPAAGDYTVIAFDVAAAVSVYPNYNYQQTLGTWAIDSGNSAVIPLDVDLYELAFDTSGAPISYVWSIEPTP